MQITAIVFSLLRMTESFVYFGILLRLINIYAVILIANRNTDHSYNTAWIFLIILFPLCGGIFYLFTTLQMHTKYYFFRLSQQQEKTKHLLPQNDEVICAISALFPERESAVRYIYNTSGMNAHVSRDATYFPTGEETFKSILSDLENARKYIFIEFFIIKNGFMWESILEILKKKASEGVDVRVMYDGVGSLAYLPHNYPEELSSFGINCCVFAPFSPFLSVLQNNRDHRKIISIDGKIAYTGGINLSDEYINLISPYGYWKDMSVRIVGPAAFNFSVMFLHLWWHSTGTNEAADDFKPDFQKNSALGKGFVMPLCDTPQYCRRTGKYIYLDIIKKAKKYVYITTPYIIPDGEILSSLKDAAKGGIDIKIICPSVPDHRCSGAVSKSYYGQLLSSGIEIYEYLPGFIHGKTICSDDNIAVVGSINLDYRSLYLQFESAAWFLDSPVVISVKKDFEKTLSECSSVSFFNSAEQGFLKKIIYAVLRLFAPLM